MRSVARRHGVALSTVQFWVKRAEGKRLDRVDWADHPAGPRRAARRLCADLEDRILATRQWLMRESDLGEHGAAAIERSLVEHGLSCVPSVRTIGRVLERRGALDGRRRVRRPAPPKGWHLAGTARQAAEVDCFDIVEGLVIKEGPLVEVLNVISLFGGLMESWPCTRITASLAVKMMIAHWQGAGLPAFAQFDNDTIFQGAHQWADSFGRVVRLCLALGVTPVFAPPRETGFQAAIENYNGRWQAKVWSRFTHRDLKQLQERSALYVRAARQRSAERIDNAPERRRFPQPWRFDVQRPLRGRVIYLRRTDEQGQAHLLGHCFPVDRLWPHRLVRCEVELDEQCIRFSALRRREPEYQPLLAQVQYVPPKRPFKG